MQKIHKRLWPGQQVFNRHRYKYRLIGVNLSVEEGVEGVNLFVEEEVEGVNLSEEEEVDGWLSFSISSFNLFMYASCDFLPRSFYLGLLGSFLTFSALSIFLLSKREKINKK